MYSFEVSLWEDMDGLSSSLFVRGPAPVAGFCVVEAEEVSGDEEEEEEVALLSGEWDETTVV